MSLISVIEDLFSNQQPLDESIHISIGQFKLFIRNRFDDGRAGNPIRHSTSIKVMLPTKGKTEYSVQVLSRSYDGIERNNITKDDIRKITAESKLYGQFVRSFIYDNQIAILAYWYLPSPNNDIRQIFNDYFIEQIKEKSDKYYDGKINPKNNCRNGN